MKETKKLIKSPKPILTMKQAIYSSSAYILVIFLCFSFHFTLVQLFKSHFSIGLLVASVIVFLAVIIIRDKDFIQEMEEIPE